MSNPYTLLTDAIAAQVSDLSFYGGPKNWNVATETKGDIGSLLDRVVAQSEGLGCYILTASGQPGEVSPRGELIVVALEVMINETYTQSDEGKRVSAMDLIWAIKQALVIDRAWAESTGYQLVDRGWSVAQKGMDDAPALAVYEMQFDTQMIFTPAT